MKCNTDKKIRVCSECGYEVKDKSVIRCPRCFKILLKKCSECDGCGI
ncbi:hypothetical protein BX659_13715 [Orenia metallireducens]|uniref:Uncharacterized protein n=1 Tax=Orenia metallireducens TaxID=1413210 RepID=A0A285I567_9FIRM|nr:hypothetical protein [Orenia metallireducens]PRX19716.1 hypothetical protein BX659_13715 [Orenia metallireducens]SNY43108.1 hypothetical protein SAMN06265827_13115 [Orenia metallireducens]